MAATRKTLPTEVPVTEFLDLTAGRHRADCDVLTTMLREVTGVEPVMWGPSIVGFGPTTATPAAAPAPGRSRGSHPARPP